MITVKIIKKPQSKIQQWSTLVKERDGRCMKCDETNDLHAHHIKPKSTNPELSLDIDNGITLCYRCHKKEHENSRLTRLRSNKPHKSTQIKLLAEKCNQLEQENEILKHRISIIAVSKRRK